MSYMEITEECGIININAIRWKKHNCRRTNGKSF